MWRLKTSSKVVAEDKAVVFDFSQPHVLRFPPCSWLNFFSNYCLPARSPRVAVCSIGPCWAPRHLLRPRASPPHYPALPTDCSQLSPSPAFTLSWRGPSIKKAEHRRSDALELWCWRGLLRVPWTAGRSNQSILKEISPGCSLEGLMLKFQYYGHLMQRTDSFDKTLVLGKTEGRRRRGRQRMRWLDGITDLMDMSPSNLQASSGRWWRTGKPGVLQSMGSQRVRHDWATELNWTLYF